MANENPKPRLLAEAGRLIDANKHAEAIQLLDKNTVIFEGDPVFFNALGVALAGNRDHELAVQSFLEAIKLNPLDPIPFAGIGNSLAKNLQYEEAEKYYRLSLVVDEHHHDAIVGLGGIYFQKSDYEECEALFKEALQQRPTSAVVLTNLANTYSAQGRQREAIPLLEKAIEHHRGHCQAHMNLGLIGLGMRQFETGWDHYEYRFHEDNFIKERFQSITRWQGPTGKKANILVWAEQGVGDELMFASIFQDLIALDEQFVIESDRRLVPLFQNAFPTLHFIERHRIKEYEGIDYQISSASLGSVFRRSLDKFPKTHTGYLAPAGPTLKGPTEEMLSSLPRPWIGVSWASYALTENFRNRKSIPPEQFSLLTRNFQGSFINLQFPNPHAHEVPREQPLPDQISTLAHLDLKNDLCGLAHLVSKMDHVITIGNSVAHLCGALGVPTKTLLPKVADWRWGFEGDRSAWYPSMTLLRNTHPTDWTELLTNLRQEIDRDYTKA
jgi:Flp pilus assembly protein TadD